MATMAVPSWAETQALIAQTQRLYETNDDVQMVKDVAQLRNSIVQTRSQQADQMAQAIAGKAFITTSCHWLPHSTQHTAHSG